MSKKLFSAQAPVTMLVPRLTGGSDPSRGVNPSKASETYTFQHTHEVPGRGEELTLRDPGHEGVSTKMGLLTGNPAQATGDVQITSNTFTDQATLYLGGYEIVSGVHWTVGGSIAASAANLASYINSLAEYSATDDGVDTVTITGPYGPDGNYIGFKAVFGGTVSNYSLSPSTGTLDSAGPTFGPPTLG